MTILIMGLIHIMVGLMGLFAYLVESVAATILIFALAGTLLAVSWATI